jgi:predicted XRE-type DNA-binding protein
MDGEQPARPVTWVGSSRRQLKRFPQAVRRDVGKALDAAQRGETDPAPKPMRGFEMAKKTTTIAHEESSGNIFTDLGLPHPEQELLKARLTLQIYRTIKARRVTQTQAGKIIGIRQPQVSLLMRNRSGNFSVERLMDFLTALGHDVEVRVTPTRNERGQLSVVVAA